MRTAALSDGVWGPALAPALQANGHDVVLWRRLREHIDEANACRENRLHPPGAVRGLMARQAKPEVFGR